MRFGLAAFGAVLIGGIAVGLAVLGSTDNTKSIAAARSAGCGSRRARFASRLALQFSSGADRPGRARRADHCSLFATCGRRQAEGEHGVQEGRSSTRVAENVTIARPASGQCAAPDERAEEPDAGSDRRTSPGSASPNGAFPPDTEGDVGPNYYMQWVNLSLRDLQQERDACDADRERVHAVHRQAALRNLQRQRRRPDRPLRPVLGPLARQPARVSDVSQRALLPVRRRTRRRATRRVPGAPTSTSRTRPTSTTIRSSASGRPSTRT